MSRTHITVVRERGPDTVVLQVYSLLDEEIESDLPLALQWLVEPLGDNPFLPGTTGAPGKWPLFQELARHAPPSRPSDADNILGWLRYTHFLAWHARELVVSAQAEPQPPACPPGEEDAEPNALLTVTVRDPSLLDHLRVGDVNDYSSPFGVERQFGQWEAALIRLSPWSAADREPLRLNAECILSYEPEHSDAHFALAELARHARDFSRASAEYQRSLAHRNDATAWARLAECDLLLGQPEIALESAHRAAALDEQLVEARLIRARVLLALGRSDEAALDLHRALELEPDASDVRALLGTIERAGAAR